MAVMQPATFPLELDQAREEALRGRNSDDRVIGIRSLRYYVADPEGDTAQRETNISVLDTFGDIVQEYRRVLESVAVAGGETPEAAAERMRNSPVLMAVSESMRRILSRPSLPGGCLDHAHPWHLDLLTLNDCKLPHAVLKKASLRYCDLTQSNLAEADLSGADLTGVELSGAKLTNANLTDADLTGAKLAWADFSHASLERAFLNQADLTGAVLDNASLRRAFLSETEMTKTSLAEADLTAANLFAAKLSLARFQGSVLKETGITPERLKALKLSIQSSPETRWGADTDRDGMNPLNPAYYA